MPTGKFKYSQILKSNCKSLGRVEFNLMERSRTSGERETFMLNRIILSAIACCNVTVSQAPSTELDNS